MKLPMPSVQGNNYILFHQHPKAHNLKHSPSCKKYNIISLLATEVQSRLEYSSCWSGTQQWIAAQVGGEEHHIHWKQQIKKLGISKSFTLDGFRAHIKINTPNSRRKCHGVRRAASYLCLKKTTKHFQQQRELKTRMHSEEWVSSMPGLIFWNTSISSGFGRRMKLRLTCKIWQKSFHLKTRRQTSRSSSIKVELVWQTRCLLANSGLKRKINARPWPKQHWLIVALTILPRYPVLHELHIKLQPCWQRAQTPAGRDSR